jgi:glyoxylase-like metal-dependent hydrolase (beta-lactamase superfamily II)
VADGVYAIIHCDATLNWPHSNTGVIVGDDGVLVVDATYLPSRAVADIALIKALTPLPVRYLVNTHWHYDHNNGNRAYLDAYPGLAIVAQRETRRIMAVTSAQYAATYVTAPGSPTRKFLDSLRAVAAAGTDAHGAPMHASARAALAVNVAQLEREQRDLTAFVPVLPTLTFDRELNIHLGRREVQIRHWGRANTPGDAAVFLPAEHVIFSGDLVVHPVPYTFNSSPVEWIEAMRSLEALPVQTLVPGHGDVQRDLRYVRQVRELLEFVVREVAQCASRGRTKDECRNLVTLDAYRDRFIAGESGRASMWDASIVHALIDRAWDAARGVH